MQIAGVSKNKTKGSLLLCQPLLTLSCRIPHCKPPATSSGVMVHDVSESATDMCFVNAWDKPGMKHKRELCVVKLQSVVGAGGTMSYSGGLHVSGCTRGSDGA